LFVDENFKQEIINMSVEIKVINIQDSLYDENIFRISRANKAVSISLFHEINQDSLYTLMYLEKFSQKENIQFTFNKLLIHIEDNRYKTELISFLEKVEHFSFPVEIMNVYEEVAKRFWKSHPYILEEQTDTHLLIVGYD